MKDTSHLVALMDGLSHEKTRLAAAKTEYERAHRQVWVRSYEQQIAKEYEFLGMTSDSELPQMSDDDLLAELMA